MCITKEQYGEIRRRHSATLITDDDILDALEFAMDLMDAEADAMEQKIPYATRSISNCRTAASCLLEAMDEIDDGNFGETE